MSEVASRDVVSPARQKTGFQRWLNRDGWRKVVAGIPFFWLLLFFLTPFFIVMVIAVSEAAYSIPPFKIPLSWEALKANISTNFGYLINDSLYYTGYLNSLKIAAISTVLCLLIGYPMAYGIARSSGATRNILLLLVILPFWTSFLLRIYAWIGLLGTNGTINNLLLAIGIIDEPLKMMNTDFAVYIGIVYSYLPFMILPLFANLERLDNTLTEAAMDLGSTPTRTFLDVTLPLSIPGIVAGSMLVFIPATGEYVIPVLLGAGDSPMIGRVLFDEFFLNTDWPVASAVAIVLLILLVVPIMVFNHYQARAEGVE
ncbi:MAG: ABC transporter permease subunit [Pseudomonadota bacterium]